jgi:multidrug efflux pump
VVIVAGVLFATLLSLFVVPVMYELLARFTRSPEWTARQIEQFEAGEKGGAPPQGVPEAAE